MINTYIIIPQNIVQESSSFTATVKFRILDAAPTTNAQLASARYRIDGSTTGEVVRDWTDLTVGDAQAGGLNTSIDITITPSDNAILTNSRREERKQLTVEANTGLDNQTRERVFWRVQTIDEF